MADVHKSRVFLWALLSCIGGVALRSFLAVPYGMLLGLGLIGATALAIGLRRSEKKQAVCGLLLIACVFGMVRFDAAERDRPDLSRLYGQPLVVRGIVVGEPIFTEKSQRLKVKITGLENRAAELGFFILATTGKYPAYGLGDEITMTGAVERPENFSGFDYVSHLGRDGIFAVMSFPRIERIGEGKGNQLRLALSGIKRAFEENISAALPEPHAAFMKGLLLGERASLPKIVEDDFQAAGVSHIVALSGYNITLVGRSLMNALLLFTVSFVISFWIAVAAITLFVLMTGAAASVVRAGIMGVLVLIAHKEGRPHQMANVLAFAGAAMVLHDPYVLRFDAGFQLSFLATIGLVYVSPHAEQWLDRLRFRLGFSDQKISLVRKKTDQGTHMFGFKRALVETLSAQIMVLPLLIYLFGRVSLISPAANLAVLIAVPCAMGAGFVAGVAGFLSETLREIAGWGAWAFLEYQLRAISFFASMPFASIEVGAWTVAPVLIVYAIIFWRVWRRSKDAEQ